MVGNKYYYIYNFGQAKYIINNGIKIVDIGTGNKNDIFFKFNRDKKTEDIVNLWKLKKTSN